MTCLLLALLAQPAPDAGAKKFLALVKEHDAALATFQRALTLARTEKDREAAFKDKHPKNHDYASRFLAVAKDHPKSVAAVDSLVWVVLHPIEKGQAGHGLRAEAFDLLLASHSSDPRLGQLCTRLILTVDPDSAAFLDGVARKAKDAAVLARAVASRAQNQKARANAIRQLKEEKPALAEYERLWGKSEIAALMKLDPDALEKDAATLFKTLAEKHGTITHPTHGTMAKLAAAHLAALSDPVSIGKAAPEISALDLFGKPLKLSAFKGKVVLLDFHGHAFGPSREMFAAEAALLKKMADKPFTILGVSGDTNRIEARIKSKAAGVSWPVWWDGGGADGPIATRWEVDRWPTVALIDHKGIVRHLWTGWPTVKELEAAIADLVGKAG